MTAAEWQLLGILLTAGGGVFLLVSQLLLSWWHRKMFKEL